MDTKERLQRGISDKLDISADLIGGHHRIIIIGMNSLFVENHRGIIGFSDTAVSVVVKGGTVSVSGEHLMIPLLTQTTMEIKGDILSYAFHKE